MNISGAWRLGFTGKNVVVTILDDGIEKDHPDLVQNYVSIFFDCCDDDDVCLHACMLNNPTRFLGTTSQYRYQWL